MSSVSVARLTFLSWLTVTIVIISILLSCMPSFFCQVTNPIPPPAQPRLGGGLDGFDSPYLGHTGSWDGHGGTLGGGSKEPDMDIEFWMGLRWTFMPVYWRKLEPDGPVDPSAPLPEAWQSLDNFVIAAQERGLNILMQAPVIGGNADGPPDWAGLREPGKSAPLNMDAAANFAAKLTERYRPGGILATQQGWGDSYGVRAWEMDNEPESYLTHWDEQAGDYAEFVTKVATRIKNCDPAAVIVAPAIAGGGGGLNWVEQTLDAYALVGSPIYKANGIPHSIGPYTDVVSFHVYEGLDTFFARRSGLADRSIDCVFMEIRSVFESWEEVPGFEYPRKQEYWHTEGNFDFFGITSADLRANWRYQFFARAFTAGIRKVNIMDAAVEEQITIRQFVHVLPDPFPMYEATSEVEVLAGSVWAYRHPEGINPADGQVWVLWAENGSSGAEVRVPVQYSRISLAYVDGSVELVEPVNGHVQVVLIGDEEISPPILLIDRSNG